MTDAPTIEERYARAMRSSHLEVTEHPGDIDKIIAAGLVREGLATSLYRLRIEYDAVRTEQSRADGLSGRAFVLMGLRSLHRAKCELADYAIVLATRGRHMLSDRVVEILTGQVLNYWLDDGCDHCQRRGYNGGSHRGEPRVMCRPCRGTKKIPREIGRDATQQAFVDRLYNEMDRMVGNVSAHLKRGVPVARDMKAWLVEQAKDAGHGIL